MLYRLVSEAERFAELEPVPFKTMACLGKREKELETLVADNILERLFEDGSLMPIFQERLRQPEADIYALDEKGALVIFELKRSSAGEGAVHQALRYAQDAGQWTYAELERKYRTYSKNDTAELAKDHAYAFNLEVPLSSQQFNRRQRLMVIGSAADDSLITAVDYWRHQGLSIEFLPYRIYTIGNESYFEFFSPPYDRHQNPGTVKGVLFDTNRSYKEDGIWCMMEHATVEAYGDAKRFVGHVQPGDFVFFSHKWCGIVAAAKVKKGSIQKPDDNTFARAVEFLTPIPVRGEAIKAMPFRKVSEVTGKSFYWARTIKVPYLTADEAQNLVSELDSFLTGG